ncbi:hypothetical protein [Dialister micraerophilus]|uniref:Adhesion protein FadA n=1 Tax=Dialister micraerophilus UPII 345-E TaxID=910314 RepID=E4LA35_9FIRM|nr:hypothetical protein [Dialister micraerophilus]EFR42314.1 hypothetical protein HMPREF9220_0602 [Dialister micraerophilus UPII 345-E]
MIKKSLLKGLLFACFLSYFAIVPCTLSSAQETYTITDTELKQLETNLETLKKHSKKKQELLTKQQNQLQEVKKELTKAQGQIKALKNLNERTQNSLTIANQYLQEYEKETSQKIKSEKRQKHIWQLATVVMTIVVITK